MSDESTKNPNQNQQYLLHFPKVTVQYASSVACVIKPYFLKANMVSLSSFIDIQCWEKFFNLKLLCDSSKMVPHHILHE